MNAELLEDGETAKEFVMRAMPAHRYVPCDECGTLTPSDKGYTYGDGNFFCLPCYYGR